MMIEDPVVKMERSGETYEKIDLSIFIKRTTIKGPNQKISQ